MKKRIVAAVLAMTVALGLVACGSGSAAPAASSAAPAASSEEAAAEPAAEEAASEEAAAPAEQQVWTFCNGTTDTHPQAVALIKFSEEFEKATEGRYHINNNWSNSLGDDESLAEMCRTGTIQGFYGSIFGSLPNYIPEFATFALPYLFRNYEEAYEYLHNSELVAELMKKLEDEYGLYYVDTTLNGKRDLTTKDFPVYSPADLKGKKIRSMTAEVWQDVIAALGGTPVPIAYSEIYVSLQTGVCDGQDNGIANVYQSKFYEIQDYFMMTDHGLTLSSFCLNADTYRGMSDEDRAIFDELWHEICVEEYADLAEAYYEEGYEAIREAGVTIIEQDEMDMQAFYDSADAIINEKYVDDPMYGPVLEDVRAYFGR